MLRGYQKRVIYLKNTGSDIFKEAYFVLEDDKNSQNENKGKLVDEANRIINENFYGGRRKLSIRLSSVLAFLLGALISIVGFLIYLFIS
jgi:hypothetical protein